MTTKKIGYILGRRIQGDLGPLQTDPLSQLPGRIMGPCVNLTGAEQQYWELSLVPNYTLGSRMVIDERTFRYCFGQTALERNIGCFNFTQWPINGVLGVAGAVAGSRTIVVPEGVCVANAYAGGWLVIFTVNMQWYRILSNTATAAGVTTLTLDRPIEQVAAAGTAITGYPNVFSNVRAPGSPGMPAGFNTVVCVPPVAVPINNFFWGQRAGPCYGVADGTVPGIVADRRPLWFAQSGNLWPFGDASAGLGAQYAGYLLPRTAAPADGDQFYWLQLE
ncbi:MAG TPA: hypothetical protein VMW64_00760 [Dehalococcoidia bacterium]|nr:hypothetical protein [Dehalococcoidia bacterium]